jgi:hypothetical protein
MPASSSADVILWKTSETLIATALVPERAGRLAERALVQPARPTILDSLAGLALLPIHEQTGSFLALGVALFSGHRPLNLELESLCGRACVSDGHGQNVTMSGRMNV